ncbi:MAG: cellulose-binding protein CttA-related protein, partial [Ruminococcus sp.]|nr:cellulose-binding protein CttA-related protein [Ruminococcus sp.]
ESSTSVTTTTTNFVGPTTSQTTSISITSIETTSTDNTTTTTVTSTSTESSINDTTTTILTTLSTTLSDTTTTTNFTSSTVETTTNYTTTETTVKTIMTITSKRTTITTVMHTGDVLAVLSEISAVPSDTNFYFSLDDREFNAEDLFESIILTVTYEDGQNDIIDITNMVSFEGITPAILFEQRDGTSDYAGVYRGYIHPTYNNEILDIEAPVYIGIKGDANLDGAVNIADATQILTYFAYNGSGMENILIDNPDKKCNELAFFLSDVDTESKIGKNTDFGQLSISDATNVLTYFAQNGADMEPQWHTIIPSLLQIPDSLWQNIA